jgi:flagellar hook-associated protein 3 FlgL
MAITRTTTNGVLKTYRRNLNSSSTTLNKARDTVLTQRNFQTFGEDPASATQAFKLRRSWQRTNSQYTVGTSTVSKFESAWQQLASVDEQIDTTASTSALSAALRGATDSTASGRNALGSELEQLAESIIQTMNGRYGDNFLFSGADGETVPFTWEGSDLYYRGVNVSASATPTAANFTMQITTGGIADVAALKTAIGSNNVTVYDASGNALADNATLTAGDTVTLKATTTGKFIDFDTIKTNAANSGITVQSSSDGTDESDYLKLLAMSNEENYVDIGIGLKEDADGNLIKTSAYNDALQGINFLGFGVDEDGDSKNVAVLIKQLGELLSNCSDNGTWQNSSDADTFNRLMGKLEIASSEFKSQYVQLDAKASFLKSNNEQLEMNCDTLNEQFLEIEQCDLADAITAFSWAQYCYNAALKVGNQILSQSLIDYMD